MSHKVPNFRRSVLARSILIACGATATVFASQPLFAQDAETKLQRVEVTGSSIKRIDAESAVPVTIVKMDELKKQGISTVEQVLSTLTISMSTQSTSQVVGSGTGGASFADIRGLGSNKTLVLLNGRRIAANSIDGSSADLNMIPFAAIDRVEVLRDGASSLYGTDAIGGVINFITKNNFTGGTVTIGLDEPETPGGRSTGFNIGGGVGDLEKDGFNIFGFIDVQKSDRIRGDQRDFNTRYKGGVSVNTYPGTYSQSQPSLADPTLPGNYGNPSAPACNSNQGIFPRDGTTFGCYQATSYFVDYAPKSERTSGFLKGTKDLGGGHQMGLEYFYTQSKVSSLIAPVPYYGLIMNPSSPYFPGKPGQPTFNTGLPYDAAFTGLYGEAGSAVPGGSTLVEPGFIYVNWRNIDGGPRTDYNTNTQQRVVASLEGTLADWDYKTALTWNENKVQVALANYQTGSIIRDGMTSGIINPWAANDATGLAYIKSANLSGTQQNAIAKSVGVDAHASRELGDWMGAGRKVGLAIGGSYSRDTMSQVGADMVFNIAVKASTGFDPDTSNIGERKVTALYSELNVPVSKTLEVTVAGRNDNYSDIGNSFNPKFGFRFQPSPTVFVRGSASTGFRAPSLYDTNSSPTYTNTTNVTDPVTGVKSQFQALTGGNPALKPETSKTVNLGIVIEPAKDLTLGADLWAIQLEQVIGTVPDTTVFGPNSALFTSFFKRNANGTLSQNSLACPGPTCGYVDLRTQNLGGTNTNGLDLSANYRLRTADMGAFTFGMQSTYVNKYEYQDYENGPWNQNVNRFVGAGVIFKWTHNATVNWNKGAFSAGLAGHYKSGYVDQNTTSEFPGNVVGSYATYDAFVGWSITKKISITYGIRNLFDKAPPLSNQVYTFQAGYDPRYTDTVGRTHYLRGNMTF